MDDDLKAWSVKTARTEAEIRGLAQQRKKAQQKTLGTSKYVPHQGRRERARRLARGC